MDSTRKVSSQTENQTENYPRGTVGAQQGFPYGFQSQYQLYPQNMPMTIKNPLQNDSPQSTNSPPEIGKKVENLEVYLVALKKLPGVDWAIAKLNTGSEYYYNFEANIAVWEPPKHILDLLEQILVQSLEEKKRWKDSEYGDEDVKRNEVWGCLDKDPEKKVEQTVEASLSIKSEADGPKRPPAVPPTKKLAEDFYSLLHEYDISPYSMWEIEIEKFKNHRAYTSMNEKKAREIFDEYCNERAKDLRSKKTRDVSKDVIDSFKSLLKTHIRSTSMSFSTFVTKYRNHPRFLGLTDTERNGLFDEHMEKLIVKLSKRKDKQRNDRDISQDCGQLDEKDQEITKVSRVDVNGKSIEDIKEDFLKLLDSAEVYTSSRWSSIEPLISKDKRYNAVKSHDLRRDYFEEYCRKYAKRQFPPKKDNDFHKQSGIATWDHYEKSKSEKLKLQERARTERLMRDKLMALQRKEAKESVKVFLAGVYKSHTKTISEIMDILKRDHLCGQPDVLSAREKEAIVRSHRDLLRKRVLDMFNQVVSSITSMESTWDEAKSIILSNDTIKSIFSLPQEIIFESQAENVNDMNNEDFADIIDEIKQTFEKLRTSRILDTKKELLQLLKDSSFIDFQVKSAIVESYARAVEEKLDPPTLEDEWKLVKLHEIMDTFKQAPPYKKLAFLGDVRDEIIYDHVQSLMDMYRNQRGGTRDLIIANYSNKFDIPRVKFDTH